MPKLNKSINTNVLEYGKTILLTAVLVGAAMFIMGMQYQKRAIVQVHNAVTVQNVSAVDTAKK